MPWHLKNIIPCYTVSRFFCRFFIFFCVFQGILLGRYKRLHQGLPASCYFKLKVLCLFFTEANFTYKNFLSSWAFSSWSHTPEEGARNLTQGQKGQVPKDLCICHISLQTLVYLSTRQIMYYFPRTAVTKYHKLGHLKQPKFVLSQLGRLEV